MSQPHSVVHPGEPSRAEAQVSTSLDCEQPPPAPAGLPQVVGYEVLSELGRGGMGVVYRARQSLPNRLVALKMLRSGALANLQELTRFRAEAEAVARLQHPHIVQVFEVGEHNGLPFFSLELCAGGNLADRLANAPLPSRVAAPLVAALARAIQAAHEQGIVHRDLKPANVLLVPSDRPDAVSLAGDGADGARYEPKISDFGLAKRLHEPGQTLTGAVMGTPSYMAPEQAAGRTRDIGPLTDVYALGAVLYEALTGRAPFRAATPHQTLLQVLEVDPAPPRQLNPAVERDLNTICLKCLQKEPAKRYPSARALADDLARFLDGDSVLARPAGPAERVVKWARRRPAWALAYGLFVAVLVLGVHGLGATWLWTRAEEARREAEEQRGRAEESQREAEAARADLARLSYLRHVDLAHREWNDDQAGRAARLLAACAPELRRWEWYYVNALCHGEEQTLRGHTAPVRQVAYSRDGSLLASGGEDGTVRLWDAATGELRRTFGPVPEGEVLAVALSPDGTVGAAGGKGGTVRLWDVATGAERLVVRAHPLTVNSLAFSPDGNRVASASFDGTVRLWDSAAGDVVSVFVPRRKAILAVAIDATGKLLATGSESGWVDVWDVHTQGRVNSFHAHSGEVTSVSFHPRLPHIVTGGWDGLVKVWGSRSAVCWATCRGHQDRINQVTYDPSGSYLASASWDSTVRLWSAETGQEIDRFKGHSDSVISVAYSPDGQRLASAGGDGTVKIWNASRTVGPVPLGPQDWPVGGIAFTADGRQLVGTGRTHSVVLWDTAAGVVTGRGHATRFDPPAERFRRSGASRSDLLAGGLQFVAFSPQQTAAPQEATPPTQPVLPAAPFQFSGKSPGLFGTQGSAFGSPQAGPATTIPQPGVPTSPARSLPLSDPTVPTAVAVSSTGRQIAAAGTDGRVRIWEAKGGPETFALEGHKGTVRCVAFKLDGALLASGGEDGVICLWDVRDGKRWARLVGHTGPVRCVAFAADGVRLASGSTDGTVRLWDLTTGQETARRLGRGKEVTGVAFGPDDRFLFASDSSGIIQVSDAATGAEVTALVGHIGPVAQFAFSPDGTRLVSGGWDGTLRLWDTATGQQALMLRRHAGRVLSVAFRPDGRAIASSGDDGLVYLWHAPPEGAESPAVVWERLPGPSVEIFVEKLKEMPRERPQAEKLRMMPRSQNDSSRPAPQPDF